MRILTILGTRPEIIRLSRIIPKLDNLCEHILCNTCQNYDPNLNDIFFRDLGIRDPDIVLTTKSDTLAGQLSKIFTGVEEAVLKYKPDKVLVLGDTNSAMAAIIAERHGSPVYHMEAGNRCYDLNVPEEKNRKVIDSISSINLPYTPGSKANLLREGSSINKIFETGNPIKEVMDYYSYKIPNNIIRLPENFILVTTHRAENVDNNIILKNIINSLNILAQNNYIIFSCHPRTKEKINKNNIVMHPNIIYSEPFSFFEFLYLEKNAKYVITDSGTVQEECCLYRVPTVTIRKTTERPETIECGSNILSGIETDDILRCCKLAENKENDWNFPVGYDVDNVSDKVVRILMGKHNV